MEGKIDLLEPYKSKYRYGYLVMNKEPRRNVILYNSKSDRSTVPYARYLYETSIGKFLPKDMVVDHINNDKLDDRLENLQVLSHKENLLKSLKNDKRGKLVSYFLCGSCGIEFFREYKNTHLPEYNSNRYSTYCSRRCGGKKLNKSTHIKNMRHYS